MRDAASVARAMAGARFLFHVAADYRLCARNPQEIMWNNREGTRLLMRSALAADVERIVYTSSAATIACAANGGQADETMRLNESSAIGAYKRSKVAAEQVVETMIARDDLPAIIVHPTAPIGPRDQKPTPTGRIIVEAASGRIPGFVDYRAQSRACRRCRERASRRPATCKGRRTLYPRWPKRDARGVPWPNRDHVRPPSPQTSAAAPAGLSVCVRGGNHGTCDAARAFPDNRRTAHVEAPDVL